MCRAVPEALRVVGLALVLVVWLAGCAGPPPGAAGGPTPTPTLTTGPGPTDDLSPTTGDGGPRPEPTSFGRPSTEPTVVMTTRRDDGGTLTVSGPTLNNRYQEDFNDFSRIPDHCGFLANEPEDGQAAALDVRVVDLRVAQQTPQGPPAFRYYDPESGDDGCQPALVGTAVVVRPCGGAVLPPAADGPDGGVGCPVGIAFGGNQGTDYTARFVVTLEADCTSREPHPCDGIEGREPSAAEPVRVRWASATDLYACLGRTGGPGHAESRGLCTHDDITTEESTGETPASGPTS